MSPEAQRIAIAEACGWQHRLATKENPIVRGGYTLPNYFGLDVVGFWRDNDPDHPGVYGSPSDYLNDLNAIHEAADNLPAELGESFAENLIRVFAFDSGIRQDKAGKIFVFAKASQWAEAYLRTIGKYRDAQ